MVACARQDNGSPKMLTLMPGTCEDITLHDQGDLADYVRNRDVEVILGDLVGSSLIP